MEITNALIIVGKENNLEHYSFLWKDIIASNICDTEKEDYEKNKNRIINDFAQAYLLVRKTINQLYTMNGYKVMDDGRLNEIDKLEDMKTFGSELVKIIKRSINNKENIMLIENFN